MTARLSALLAVAGAVSAEETCNPREGVFFSDAEFPGTPGAFANERSTPEELARRVASWTTEYQPTGALTAEQHRQFFEDGFVIVPDLVPHDVLESAIASVETLVDHLAHRLHAAGKISELHEGAGFDQRLTLLEEQFPHASVLLHKNGVLPDGIQRVWDHRALMAVAQQLLGADVDIAGHPVWNLRCKTPERLSHGQATVPWHQDNAYLDEESWATLQVTAWVPLVSTNATNGCMQVVRGAHRSGGTATHACCVGGTWYTEITPEEIEATLGADMQSDVVTCEVPFGSVLLLNNLVPHRSLPNYSGGIRWSLDLRWQRADEPNGFHGLKESKLMKRAHEAYNGSVAWGAWARQDRTVAQLQELSPQALEQAIDTTIAGPWMRRWPLAHSNRHTANLRDDGSLHGWGGGGLKKQPA
mmetsp:Transcript_68988/g.206902  ORF Transcript_68988/g.206902 Transcript_68988/m.206902 type:complete len:416 (+) Transcript_68988:23-1270(+)